MTILLDRLTRIKIKPILNFYVVLYEKKRKKRKRRKKKEKNVQALFIVCQHTDKYVNMSHERRLTLYYH